MASIGFFGLICFALQLVFLFWHGLRHIKQGERKIGYIKLTYFFFFFIICLYANTTVLVASNIDVLFWMTQWGLAPLHLVFMFAVWFDLIEKSFSIEISTIMQTINIMLLIGVSALPLYLFDDRKKLSKFSQTTS